MHSTMKLLSAQTPNQYILHNQSQLFRTAYPHSKFSLPNPTILPNQHYKQIDPISISYSQRKTFAESTVKTTNNTAIAATSPRCAIHLSPFHIPFSRFTA